MNLKKSAFAFAFMAVLFCHSISALAVPSFARQTGQECSACHVGSFGPQLTPFGRDFKLNGYTMGGLKNKFNNFSAMAFGGFEHTDKNLSPGTTDFKSNDNWTLDQASIFYAGALTSNIGVMAQATYDGVDDSYAWDNTDIRYANNTSVAGKHFVYGVTANNNPSVQDLWQTTPAWTFPYLSSGVAPTPDAAPYISGLGGTVGGLGVYSMWNNLLYAELSGYSSLPNNMQTKLGEQDVTTSDHLDGVAPYWRVALQHNFGQHYVSFGTFGMYAKRYPGDDRSQGTDTMVDNALDATYQFSSGDHNVSVYGSALHENQDLSATNALLGSTNTRDTLNNYRANASYYYKNAYGLTVGRFVLNGSSDALLYADSTNSSPNSAGWTMQADLTPFGTENSFGYPNLNARFFVQYTAYDKFNGTASAASANNTLFLGTWLAF
jgi:hypothetical protein